MAKEGHVYSDPIHQSEQDSINPGFYRPSGASNDLNNLENGTAKQGYGRTADGDAGNAESAASEQQSNSPLAQISQAENSIKSNVKGAAITAATGGKIKGAKAKKIGPLALILFILLGGGAFFIGGQSALPFSFVNRIIEEFNTISISNTARANRILAHFMKKGQVPANAEKKLAQQGIKVVKEGNTQHLEFEDADGKTHKVKANELDKFAKNNPEFKKKYTVATATWRGQNSGWYDSTVGKTLKRIGVTRDRWREWKNNTNEDAETKTKKFKEKAGSTEVAKDDGTRKSATTEEEDEDGNKVKKEKSTTEPDSVSDAVKSRDKNKVSGALKSKVGNLATGVSQSVCGAMSIVRAINALVIAQKTMEMITVASGLLEAVQKVQAGKGDEAPVHEYMNALTQNDSNGKNAASAAGFATIYSGTNKDESYYKNNTSVTSVNRESLVGDVASKAGGLFSGVTAVYDAAGKIGLTYKVCLDLQIASGVVDLIVTAVSFASGFGAIIKAVAGAAATGIIANIVIDAVVPAATEYLLSAAATEMLGEDLGNYVVSGSEYYLSANHQQSGGTPAGKDQVLAFKNLQDEIIAERADYDRATLSPFDTSNPHTFFGSIFASMAATSTTSWGQALTSFSTLTKNSLASLIPGASAVSTTGLNRSIGNCPDLESIGVVGDLYCNPYYTTDTNTLDEEYEDVIAKFESITASESGKKDYENFTNFCENRTSSYGTPDEAIAASITGGGSIADYIPVAQDFAAIAEAAASAANEGWISGRWCVNSSENEKWNDEIRWFQRYEEDKRLVENLEGGSSSNLENPNVIAYNPGEIIEEDEENTYLASLSRLSGLSVNEVSEVLDLLNTSTDTGNTTTGQIDLRLTNPISFTNLTPANHTPLHTTAANATNQSYISAAHIVYAPTRAATTTI